MAILVTGGAGFIGSCFVLDWLRTSSEPVITLDALTYAGHRGNLRGVDGNPLHTFVHGDIADRALVDRLLATHRPRAVVHFAAESHVDRSIAGPDGFLRTNIIGTYTLLEACRHHLDSATADDVASFRFVNVSTDEVFGALTPDAPPSTEDTAYAPNSPYAATKAAADHLARAWHTTYRVPLITTNCSNNYGPRQFPEKLIPLMIVNALAGQPLPLYGDGEQVRDWLYVSDHCAALRCILSDGVIGETYNIGGGAERTNREVVRQLCALLDSRVPSNEGTYARLIRFVADRPGHDRRYAIDTNKLRRTLGWMPQESFETGLAATVDWYLAHRDWLTEVTSGAYREWMTTNYGHR